MRAVIGIDIGTTSVCGIAADAETGRLLASRTLPNVADLPPSRPFERAQDPLRIRTFCEALLADLAAAALPARIAAIGVTGQMHGVLYLDRRGNPLSPLWTWQDGRGRERDPRTGESYAQHLARLTGYSAATGYGLTTHFYNLANGLVPAQTARLSTIHDWVAMSLTGNETPLLHVSDAASLGLFDLQKGDFDREALRRADIPADALPEVTAESRTVGLTADGIPVCVALGDNQASVLGSVRDNALLVNVGTGSQVSAVTERFFVPAGAELRPFVDGAFLVVGCALCGGYAYSLLKQFFEQTAGLLGAAVPEDLYARMNRAAALAQDEPIAADTRFAGTREQPTLRGSFAGVSTTNFTPGHLSRAVLSGIVAELRNLYADFAAGLSAPPATLVGSGNGIRKNPLLAELFANAFGMPISVPLYEEEAAYGAALFALRAACGVPLAQVRQKIQYRTGGNA